MSKVAIKKCLDYTEKDIRDAIKQIFLLLDLKRSIRPKMKVLLKPNLLTALKPEKGATTHPLIVKAIAEEVKALGAHPFIGDSPGGTGASYEKILKATGMKALGIPIVDFEERGMRKLANPGSRIDPIYISNIVLDADLMINIPKFKTHELTTITCGIKNLFGCVPGLNKVNYHLAAPDQEGFSSLIVDLYEKIRPSITIIDAIQAMEGQGPTNGKLRELGLIVASTDTLAADAICSYIVGFEPLKIPTTRIAYERKLGEADINKIELVGDPVGRIDKFIPPATGFTSLVSKIPRPLLHIIKPLTGMIKIRPGINKKKCVKCMMCVNSCPVGAIDRTQFKIDKNKCIMCFCCRELCKYGAVELKENILWKMIYKIAEILT